MSTDTAAILEEIEEYQTINAVIGKSWVTTDAQLDRARGLLGRCKALLSAHAVIDKETAKSVKDFMSWYDADDSEMGEHRMIGAYKKVTTELSRITPEADQ